MNPIIAFILGQYQTDMKGNVFSLKILIKGLNQYCIMANITWADGGWIMESSSKHSEPWRYGIEAKLERLDG